VTYGLAPEVLVAFITSGFGLVGVLAGYIVPNMFKQRRLMSEVREQVANSHSTNLRDDLDHVRDLLYKVIDGQAQFREDLAIERRERISGDERRNN